MPDEIKADEFVKREVPTFGDEKTEVPMGQMSILEIVNVSLNEFKTSIKSEFAKLESRIAALEKG